MVAAGSVSKLCLDNVCWRTDNGGDDPCARGRAQVGYYIVANVRYQSTFRFIVASRESNKIMLDSNFVLEENVLLTLIP